MRGVRGGWCRARLGLAQRAVSGGAVDAQKLDRLRVGPVVQPLRDGEPRFGQLVRPEAPRRVEVDKDERVLRHDLLEALLAHIGRLLAPRHRVDVRVRLALLERRLRLRPPRLVLPLQLRVPRVDRIALGALLVVLPLEVGPLLLQLAQLGELLLRGGGVPRLVLLLLLLLLRLLLRQLLLRRRRLLVQRLVLLRLLLRQLLLRRRRLLVQRLVLLRQDLLVQLVRLLSMHHARFARQGRRARLARRRARDGRRAVHPLAHPRAEPGHEGGGVGAATELAGVDPGGARVAVDLYRAARLARLEHVRRVRHALAQIRPVGALRRRVGVGGGRQSLFDGTRHVEREEAAPDVRAGRGALHFFMGLVDHLPLRLRQVLLRRRLAIRAVALVVLLLVPREDVVGHALLRPALLVLVRLVHPERAARATEPHLVHVARAAHLVRADVVGQLDRGVLAGKVRHRDVEIDADRRARISRLIRVPPIAPRHAIQLERGGLAWRGELEKLRSHEPQDGEHRDDRYDAARARHLAHIARHLAVEVSVAQPNHGGRAGRSGSAPPLMAPRRGIDGHTSRRAYNRRARLRALSDASQSRMQIEGAGPEGFD